MFKKDRYVSLFASGTILAICIILRIGLHAGAVGVSTIHPITPASINIRKSLPASSEFVKYLQQPEPETHWELTSEKKSDKGTTYDIRVTSLKWEKTIWTNRLLLFVPSHRTLRNTTILMLRGYNGGNASIDTVRQISNITGAAVAELYGIPNEPIDNRAEDQLLGYSLAKYMQTHDPNEPLFFPMTKCVHRAMDVIQQLGHITKVDLDNFIIMGQSKRGATTWLTGASDKRVVGIIPLGYDALNLKQQIPYLIDTHQVGVPMQSFQKLGLLDSIKKKDPWGLKLADMIDPYTYRKSLNIPKLVIISTNDPYWSTNAVNLYWKKLPGPKSLLFLPNQGHSGQESNNRTLNTGLAFVKSIGRNIPMPVVNANYNVEPGKIYVTTSPNQNAISATIWTATSDTVDFHNSTFVSQSMDMRRERKGAHFSKYIDIPKSGKLASFIEITFRSEGNEYSLTSPIKIQ